MTRRLPPFTTDRAPIDRPPVGAVVALGANLGDRAATLAAAVDELARLPLTDAVRASAPIESVAVTADDRDAPPYLNAVALVTTRLAPSVLLSYLHAIEARHGRIRDADRDIRVAGSADRTLDLDLVAYGDVVQDDARLTLPHPRAGERMFVLEPWLALDPDAVLPGRGRVADLVADATTAGGGTGPASGCAGASGDGGAAGASGAGEVPASGTGPAPSGAAGGPGVSGAGS